MTNRMLLAGGASLLLIASATAQTLTPSVEGPVRGVFQTGGSQLRQDGFVRVQSSLNFFVPGPTGDSEEAQKLREKARSLIYQTAARECDLLKETLAKDCRLESVNSNINTNRPYGQWQQPYGQTQPEGFTINGSMSFQVTLK